MVINKVSHEKDETRGGSDLPKVIYRKLTLESEEHVMNRPAF